MKYANKLLLVYFTFVNLRFIQIVYRVYYGVRNKITSRFRVFPESYKTNYYNYIDGFISSENTCDLEKLEFCFLNKFMTFETVNSVDFGAEKHGELWCYNLNYFDYINQPNSANTSISLIRAYVGHNYDSLHITNDPYPVSMRIVNMIKFASANRFALVRNDLDLVNDLIDRDANNLEVNIERHLMGNHILENYLALVMASLYFSNKNLFNKYGYLLIKELNEQFLDDGFHFELSIMYHNILSEKLLDLYALTKSSLVNNFIECKNLNSRLKVLLIRLLSVVYEFRHDDGTLPLFNDVVYSYKRVNKILDYAEHLGLRVPVNNSIVLNYENSGYFKIKQEAYTLFFDVGPIGPKYIPGHGHCDLLSIELSVYGEKIFTNTGVSTYDYNDRRILERSTASHNTVYNSKGEQSEIWSRFRVARHAKVLKREIVNNNIIGKYQNFNKKYTVERMIKFQANGFSIDDLSNRNLGEINFYCMPGIKVNKFGKLINVGKHLVMECEEGVEVSFIEYDFAQSYNALKRSICINIKCNVATSTIHFSIKGDR